ncbi:hypothetical protein [Nonomuraea typhae]|uniref:Uncharacterized protein n=1 Tax=Nonomuraea typhae TaxID=2603600 RepID=A0ABW7YLG0_9ACTN
MTEPHPAGDPEPEPPEPPASPAPPPPQDPGPEADGAAEPATEPPAPADSTPEERPQRVSPDEEETDDDLPLNHRMVAEERERSLRELNLATLALGSAHQVKDSVYAETHGGDIFIGSTVPRARAHPVARHVVEATLVPTESYWELVKRLDHESLVVLGGGARSGREFAALAALLYPRTGRNDEPEAAVLMLDADPAELRESDLSRGVGYVVDGTGADWRRRPERALRQLADLARRLSCRFVVLAGPEGLAEQIAVPHDRPEPERVFARWLRHGLRDQAGALPAGVVAALGLDGHDSTRSTGYDTFDLALLAKLPGYEKLDVAELTPGESARLAREAAKVLVRKGDLASLSELQPRQLREKAQRLLDDRDVALVCFTLSAAVLNGLSVVTVTRAAAGLAELIGTGGEGAEPRSWAWLEKALDHAEAETEESESGDKGRVVRLRQPLMAAAILEVAWREGQSIRDPLQAWLSYLSEHPQREVRIKAAHAIGRLAAFDFDVIDHAFLRKWSGAKATWQTRWLAAWTLEAGARVEEIAPLITRRLADWSKGTRAQRSIVVKAYGSWIGEQRVEEAMNAFRRVLVKEAPPYMQEAVARSVTEILTPASAAPILAHADEWARLGSWQLSRTAALVLTRLVVAAGGLRVEWFDSAEWALARPRLVRLWVSALAHGLGRGFSAERPVIEAWSALTAWVTGWADLDERRRGVVEEVFRLSDSALDAPLRMHMKHWYLREELSADLARHLDRLMKEPKA